MRATRLLTRSVPFALVVCLAFGCAYPRRGTSLSPVSDTTSGSPPSDVWKFTVLRAVVTPRQRSGQEWDEDGSGPDPFVRIYRGGDLVWESETVEDSLQPDFSTVLPRNLHVPGGQELRLELWDSDSGLPQVIGIWRGRGLPDTALPGAESTVLLEGRSSLTIRIDRPAAHRGAGIDEYEERGGGFRVTRISEHSPAGRAGLRVGDTIVAIEGQDVGDMDARRAASQLSMAGTRRSTITIERAGSRQDLELDGGMVWLTM